jgi:hypothetical protein
MTTVGRRQQRSEQPVNLDYVLLRFQHGAFVIDPRECPLGIMTYSHWRLREDSDSIPAGDANTVCSCDAILPMPDIKERKWKL